ncbi:Radial spoke head protein 9-like protein [Frankliniella fusca]|uniref:Radial spoke head protein 9 homolog n=1 Tax=Frankliniella fusca TaxID=407009 RepID=A0AAE1GTR8_9NEOP|nr:Radial spoke head protein 9-like protein [Frankliniella fusca]
MNVKNLSYALDLTCVAGHTLSMEEIYVVQNALLILQGENHLDNIYFMGKLFGIEKDYYLAFGYRSDARIPHSFFYSNNQYDWFLLSEPSPCSLKLAPRVYQRFTGDPSQLIDWRDAGDSINITGRGSVLKEEDRLSAVVYSLHKDCAIAPKGAFFVNVEGLMEINPTFQGLSLQQGTDAGWWEHTHRQDGASSGDFLQNKVQEDVWSFRIRAQGSVSVLLHLEWLGLAAYHRLRTPEHGFVYFGDGLKFINKKTSVKEKIQQEEKQI